MDQKFSKLKEISLDGKDGLMIAEKALNLKLNPHPLESLCPDYNDPEPVKTYE
jgi:hypothetical protein